MNTQTKWVGIIIVVILVIWGISNFKTSNEPARPASGEPIKIGATLALSGPFAFIGEAEQKGLILGVEEVNERGGVNGRPLKLIIEDNEGQADKAVTSVQKLISTDNVDIIFSAFTHITQAVKGVVAGADIPMLYASSIPTIAEENQNFFRDYMDGRHMGGELAEYVSKTEYTKIGYLGEQSDVCDLYKEGVDTVFSQNNTEIIVEEYYLADSTDLRTSLSKIKAAGVDALLTCTWTKSNILMPQLKALGMIELPTFQFVAPFLPYGDSEEIRKLYEENGTISTWYGFVYGSLNQDQQTFVERYTSRFEGDPSSDSGFAYDDVMAMAEVLEECLVEEGGVDTTCFSETLTDIEYNGVAGELSFDESGVSQRPSIIVTLVDGEWVEID